MEGLQPGASPEAAAGQRRRLLHTELMQRPIIDLGLPHLDRGEEDLTIRNRYSPAISATRPARSQPGRADDTMDLDSVAGPRVIEWGRLVPRHQIGVQYG